MVQAQAYAAADFAAAGYIVAEPGLAGEAQKFAGTVSGRHMRRKWSKSLTL